VEEWALIERLAISWHNASIAVVAALAWLSASLVSCPQVSLTPVSKAAVEITAATPSPEPMTFAIADDDRDFLEDDLEPCELPGVRLAPPPGLTPSQITSPQSVSLAVLTPVQRPQRC
jgi:hypothetical protein